MNDTTVQNLMKISTPRQYEKGACIFREGDPGEELLIILRGSVGVYISDFFGESVQVSTMRAGELFGEMALVDRQPRSATCVALEDSLFVAIDRSNLSQMIATCPDVAENLLWALTARLRKAENAIYKTDHSDPDFEQMRMVNFSIPELHRPHKYWKPEITNSKSLQHSSVYCPACGQSINIEYADPTRLSAKEVLSTQRVVCHDLDPLWHNLCTCPLCGYTNRADQFASARNQLANVSQELSRQYIDAIEEEDRVLEAYPPEDTSAFDQLVFQYYRAIHINDRFNPDRIDLSGRLWLELGWLYEDTQDMEMRDYCHERALNYFVRIYRRREELIPMERTRQRCALVIAELYVERGDCENAKHYYSEVAKYSDKQLRKLAQEQLEKL